MKLDSPLYDGNDALILKLRYFLNFELSTSLLYALSFFNSLALFLATAAAIIFTPFMIYVLIKTKKYGWIALFLTMIVIPSVLSLLFIDKTMYKSVFLLIELGMFYLYCFTLRLAVNDWCEEIKWKMFRKERKKENEENKNLLQNYF